MVHPPSRVLLAVDSLGGGAAEHHVLDLACELERRRLDVLVAASAGGHLEPAFRERGVQLCIAGARAVKRRVDPRYARWLGHVVDWWQPDVVHAHLFATEAAASVATAQRLVPLVVTEHTEAPWQGDLERRWSGRVFQRSAFVIAVSAAIERRVRQCFAVPPDKVRRILPITGQDGRPVVAQRRAGSGWHIGCLARLQPEEGVDVLLAALAELRADGTDVRLRVLGEGPLRPALVRLADELGVADAVDLAGWRADARELLPQFDVVVVPSRHDGTPLVVAEAVLAGVAVVATRVGGLPERVDHGHDGLLVPPDDPGALAAAVRALLADDALRTRLASAGRQRLSRAEFSSMVDAVVSVYDEACRPAEAVHLRRPRVPVGDPALPA